MHAAERPFNWRRAVLGAGVGAAVGAVAHALEMSPWLWIVVPVGFALGGALKLEPNVLWGHK